MDNLVDMCCTSPKGCVCPHTMSNEREAIVLVKPRPNHMRSVGTAFFLTGHLGLIKNAYTAIATVGHIVLCRVDFKAPTSQNTQHIETRPMRHVTSGITASSMDDGKDGELKRLER